MNFQSLGARWIWDGTGAGEVNQYRCFRKEFTLDGFGPSQLYICADTNYAVWLNGNLVDFGGYLAYPDHKYYDTLDVTEYLQAGVNRLCILAYYQGVDAFNYAKGVPGLIFALTAGQRLVSNADTLVCKGSGFIDGEAPPVSRQLGQSFCYDATRETDWDADMPKSQVFQSARVLEFSDVLPEVLQERPIARLDYSGFCEGSLKTQGYFAYTQPRQTVSQDMQYAAMSYAEREDIMKNENMISGNVYLVFDLGAETAGHVEFEVEAAQGTQIDIACGEHLEDLRVRAFIEGRNFGFRYIAKEGINRFTSYFRRMSGRYLQVNVHNVNGYCRIRSIGMRTAVYPVAEVCPLKMDDLLCSMIDQACVRTLRLCMHEHYEDTPWREQSLYAMDARVQALCGYYVFQEYPFAKASFDLLGSSLREDGFLDMCAPSVIENTIPSFSFMWIIAVCEYVFYSGDKQAGIRYFSQIRMMVSNYMNFFKDGIMQNPIGKEYWNFYDWQPYLDGETVQDCDVLFQLFLYLAVLKATDLAVLLDRPEAQTWKTFLTAFQSDINRHFYNKKRKRYSTFLASAAVHNECELAQSLALCCGICPDAKDLRRQLAQPNDMTPVMLVTAVFKYDALLQEDIYKPFVLAEIKQKWGKMLAEGATTCYETEEGAAAFNRAGSLCHGWSAVPSYIFRRYFQ